MTDLHSSRSTLNELRLVSIAARVNEMRAKSHQLLHDFEQDKAEFAHLQEHFRAQASRIASLEASQQELSLRLNTLETEDPAQH